jgi:hypothetical protein
MFPLLNVLPKEIVIFIFSFAPEHRENIKIINNELTCWRAAEKITAFNLLYDRYLFIRDETVKLNFPSFITHNNLINKQETLIYINSLTNCPNCNSYRSSLVYKCECRYNCYNYSKILNEIYKHLR